MREFPGLEVDRGYPVERAKVGDLEISYHVLPQVKNPAFPDFVFPMARLDPRRRETHGRFGVSDSVPKTLRPYWVAHEVIEARQTDVKRVERRVIAEAEILKLVPSELRAEYIDRRIAFFKKLSDHVVEDLASRADNYTEEDFAGAESALEFLNEQPLESPGRARKENVLPPEVKIIHALITIGDLAGSGGKSEENVQRMIDRVNKLLDSFEQDIFLLKEKNPGHEAEIDYFVGRVARRLRMPEGKKAAVGHARLLFLPRAQVEARKKPSWARKSKVTPEARALAGVVMDGMPAKLAELDLIIAESYPIAGDQSLGVTEMWKLLFDNEVLGMPLKI